MKTNKSKSRPIVPPFKPKVVHAQQQAKYDMLKGQYYLQIKATSRAEVLRERRELEASLGYSHDLG